MKNQIFKMNESYFGNSSLGVSHRIVKSSSVMVQFSYFKNSQHSDEKISIGSRHVVG